MASVETHSLVRALKAVPVFGELDNQALLGVVACSSNLFWRAGAAVFDRGDPAEGLYVVLSGAVGIRDEGGEVARIEPGGFFGERSLLMSTQHSRSADAVEDSELMVVPTTAFGKLLDEQPELAAHVRRTLKARLGAGDDVLELTEARD